MPKQDVSELYIKYQGHPSYEPNVLFTDTAHEALVSQIEMVLFTNKGELIGDPDFGCDMERMLWQTALSAERIREAIVDQIRRYITSLDASDYKVDVYIFRGDLRDIAEVYITLDYAQVLARFN